MMSNWLNTKQILELSPTIGPDHKQWLREHLDKPCRLLGYCPYGQLVEAFPFHDPRDKRYSCRTFGHDCPVFYQAEKVTGFEYIDFKSKEVKTYQT